MFLKADMEISKCKQRQTKHQNIGGFSDFRVRKKHIQFEEGMECIALELLNGFSIPYTIFLSIQRTG